MGLVSEVLLGQFCNFALKALEEKYIANLHLPIDIITKSVAFFPDPASSSSGAYAALSATLLDSVLRAKKPEHTSGYIAEICSKSSATFLVRELLSDISSQDLTGNQASGNGSSAAASKGDSSMLERTKNIATFIEVLAKVCPQTVYQHIPLLMPLLESAHHVRSALMYAMGQLVIHTHKCISATTDPIAPVEPTDSDGSNPFSDGDISNLTSLREALLDILQERAHDVSPFTRSAVLKTWREMLEAGAIPVAKVGVAAVVAADRINDRIALVRKNAASLMTVVLEQNPFAGTLNDATAFTSQKEEAEQLLNVRMEELRSLIKSLTTESDGGAMDAVEKENEEDANEANSTSTSKPTTKDLEDDLENNAAVIEDKVVVDCKYKIAFCSSAIQLLQSVGVSLPRIKDMLRSETLSDVIEAIRFLSKAVRFDIAGAYDAFNNALSLVWHQEKNIQKAIFNAFCSVYICDCDLSLPDVSDEQSSSSSSSSSSTSIVSGSQSQSQSSFSSFPLAVLPGQQSMFSSDIIAFNLIKLVQSCASSGGEMVSLEKIIGSVLSDSALNKSIVQTLWTIVSNGGAIAVRRAGSSLKKRDVLASSLRILSMVLQNEKSGSSVGNQLQVSQISLMSKIAFDEESFIAHDFASMKSALLCLQTLPTYLEKVHSSRSYVNTPLYAAIQDLFPLLVKAICGHFVDDRDETMTSKWFSLCEEAVHALFHLHPTPDKVMSTTVNFMFGRLLHSQQQQQQDNSSTGRLKCSSAELSRFLFVLGQTAMNSLVYIEHIAGYAKKAAIQAATNPSNNLNVSAMNSTMLDNVSMNSSITLPTPLATPRMNESTSSSASSFVGGEKAVNAMEEEMDTAAAVDAEQERILYDAVENDLCLRNILGKFLPIVSFIVANQSGAYSDSTLRLTSVLTLCRFMSTSSVICEASLPLLFTTLEREASVQVRSTIVIALGDLAFRFPNSVEPWTDRIYMRLSDTSPAVRYNTLMVITHLVLNDMLKVKGQVSQVVLSLNDSCTEVRDLAHVFFKKLADRSNNPVYNLLGDIIGVFSQDDNSSSTTAISTTNLSGNSTVKQLTEEEFKETMHFMLSFVKKDKQADNLLERLMLRMGSASSLRQRRYLAFCISELSVTEKGLKKMIELIKNVKEALYDEAVFKHFETALSKAKKSNRSAKANSDGIEVKTTMEELETLLAGIRKLVVHGEEVAMEEDCDENDASVADEQQPTGTAGDKQTRASSARKPPLSNGKKNAAAKKGGKGSAKAAATKSKRSKKAIAYSDEEEEDDNIEDEQEERGIAERDDDVMDEDEEEPVAPKASKLPPKGKSKAKLPLPSQTSAQGKQQKNAMTRALMEL